MAKPSYPRARRLAETIRRLVGEWLETAPDRPGPLVTVTDVRVTPDLRHARVFFTVLGDEPASAATAAWLAGAAGRARSLVAAEVRLRRAPTLEFVSDELPGRGERIDRLLAELGSERSGNADPGADAGSHQEGSHP
jgi:ribosome-binding factor A